MKPFIWPVRVYYEDTDHGRVVYYANYLKYMERARTECLRAWGLHQSRLIEQDDLIFVVRSVQADYLRPAQFDDCLAVTAEIKNISRLGVEFYQRIFRVDEGFFNQLPGHKSVPDKELLCEGHIKVVSLSASSMRPKRMPQQLIEEMLSEH